MMSARTRSSARAPASSFGRRRRARRPADGRRAPRHAARARAARRPAASDGRRHGGDRPASRHRRRLPAWRLGARAPTHGSATLVSPSRKRVEHERDAVEVRRRARRTAAASAATARRRRTSRDSIRCVSSPRRIAPAMRALPLNVCSVRRSCARPRLPSCGLRRQARTSSPACGKSSAASSRKIGSTCASTSSRMSASGSSCASGSTNRRSDVAARSRGGARRAVRRRRRTAARRRRGRGSARRGGLGLLVRAQPRRPRASASLRARLAPSPGAVRRARAGSASASV